MKKSSIYAILVITCSISAFSQHGCKSLKVISITEYSDGYLIKGIELSSSDTISIISERVGSLSKSSRKKISIDNEFLFEIEDVIGKMSAVPSNSFVAKIKTTVVWRQKDGFQNRPFYARNLQGLHIRRSGCRSDK